jgi:hypothetical protein
VFKKADITFMVKVAIGAALGLVLVVPFVNNLITKIKL